jgi:hypothetical protein
MSQEYAIDGDGNVGSMVRLCGAKFRGRGSWINQERRLFAIGPADSMSLEMFPCSLQVHV